MLDPLRDAAQQERRRTLRLRAVLLAGAMVVVSVGAASAGANAAAAPAYRFAPIAFLGDPAPGGGQFTNDFEPSAVNDRGEVAFTADVTTGGEGVFVADGGNIVQATRSGLPAPGGGTMSFAGELGRLGLDERGDVAVPFLLDPIAPVCGFQSGLWRFAQGTLSPVAVPGTAAPGGGVFAGVNGHAGENNRGDIVFTGLVSGTDIDPSVDPGCDGVANALYLARSNGSLSTVVRPGDAAPGGGVFDSAMNASINDGGDIAFGAHIVGDSCVGIGNLFACGESVYLRTASNGAIRSIAHQGDPSPCGGRPYQLAFGPLVNNRGDLAFIGSLGAPDSNGVFLYSRGSVVPVACPGDPMPGGGAMHSAGDFDATYGLNNAGDIGFAASLDTDVNNDGLLDSGLYVASRGSLRLVARTGTVVPGLGTIAYLGSAPVVPSIPLATGGELNNRGQVLLYATLADGRGVLLLATPTH